MTIDAATPLRESYDSAGVVVNDVLLIGWNVFDPDEIDVFINRVDTPLIRGTDYNITLKPPNFKTADLVVLAPMADDLDGTNPIVIRNDLDFRQGYDASSLQDLPPIGLELVLDRLALYSRQLRQDMLETLRFAPSSGISFNGNFPDPVAGKLIRFTDDGLNLIADIDGSVIAAAEANADRAETAATGAEATLDSFDDRYLGAKASAPSLDNDGNALLTGALYWHIGNAQMNAWSGSVWKIILNNYDPAAVAITGGTVAGISALSVANGTKALPSVAFDSDLDTGFYRIGANDLGVSAGDTLIAGFSTLGLDAKRIFVLSGVISPSQITANQNNYDPNGLSGAVQLRIDTDASRNFTGLVGGAEGRILLWTNIGSFNEVLTNQDAASTAANRFLFADGDRTLTPNESVLLRYDGTTARWRAVQDVVEPVGGLIGLQVFTTSGTWTPNGNATTALIIATGGGEGGLDDVAGNSSGRGGVAAKTVMEFVSDIASIGTPSVTIGAGGGNDGGNGGNTLVGSLATAPGGGSGTAAVGDVQIIGGAGGIAAPSVGTIGGIGGSSYWGGPGAKGAGGAGSDEGQNNDASGTVGIVIIQEW